MGSWGYGNLENDAALDFFNDFMRRIESGIDEMFATKEADLDYCGEYELMPTISILVAIMKEHWSSIPCFEKITQWKNQYVELYDQQIDHTGNVVTQESKRERRQPIEESFDELLRVAKRN